MARTSSNARTRKTKSKPRRGKPAAGLFLEQARATAYTQRWHATNDWVDVAIGLMDELPARQPSNDRITIRRASMVYDMSDDEEAYERGLGLESLDIPAGPHSQQGGRRRVIIRMLTWIPDDPGGIAYSPQWIVTGHGLSAHSASAAHARYLRGYASAVARGIESRRLIVTAMEILWWTTGPDADYV